MIASFLASWALFHNTYLAGWLIGLLLALVGVLVVARDQIFIGAAVSQASMLGIAVGMHLGTWLGLEPCAWCDSDAFLAAAGSAFAVLGALITARASGPAAAAVESHEAVTGWVFLTGSSLAVLLLAHSPHGLEEVHRLLSSTIIGATRGDVMLLAVMVAITVVALLAWRERLLLLVLDPEMAAAAGVRVALWNRILCVWLGLAVGVSIRVSGMIYTFGCLVLPALVAKSLCREVHAMFPVAAVASVGVGLVGFVLANARDFPPGQMTVAILAGVLAGAWALRRIGRGYRE